MQASLRCHGAAAGTSSRPASRTRRFTCWMCALGKCARIEAAAAPVGHCQGVLIGVASCWLVRDNNKATMLPRSTCNQCVQAALRASPAQSAQQEHQADTWLHHRGVHGPEKQTYESSAWLPGSQRRQCSGGRAEYVTYRSSCNRQIVRCLVAEAGRGAAQCFSQAHCNTLSHGALYFAARVRLRKERPPSSEGPHTSGCPQLPETAQAGTALCK